MINPFLIGETIYLRAVERSDALLARTWLNDPQVRRTTLRHRPLTLHEEEEYITKSTQREDTVIFVIARKADDQAIGLTGLHSIETHNSQAVFGIAIGEVNEWGRGYGTEATRLMVAYAFGTLNLNRVSLLVFADNERGIRCYEKVGFKREGILRQENYREGKYGDTWLMAILREEWQG